MRNFGIVRFLESMENSQSSALENPLEQRLKRIENRIESLKNQLDCTTKKQKDLEKEYENHLKKIMFPI